MKILKRQRKRRLIEEPKSGRTLARTRKEGPRLMMTDRHEKDDITAFAPSELHRDGISGESKTPGGARAALAHQHRHKA